MFSAFFPRRRYERIRDSRGIRGPRRGRRRGLSTEQLEDRLLPSGGIQAIYAVTSDWGSGFQGQITLQNTQPTPVSNWRLEMDWPVSIESIWDAQVVNHVGNHFAVTGASYDASIPAGASLSFGFVANPGHSVAPANMAVNGIPTDDGQQSAPAISISDATATVTSTSNLTMTFAVTLSASSSRSVTVSYVTADGSAVAGKDYQATSGMITFAPGQTSRNISVVAYAAPAAGSSRTFSLNLSNASGGTIARARANGTIVTNTPPNNANATFQVNSDWGSGFTAQISVKNPGTTAINNWTLAFDFPYQITAIWDATIQSHSGNHYVIQPASYNSTIPAGNSRGFGFNGSPGGVTTGPTNYVLTGGGGTGQVPVATNDSAWTYAGQQVAVGVLANDSDPAGYPLTVTSYTQGAHGTVTPGVNGSLVYSPATGFVGSDTFSYVIGDGHGGKASASVAINVLANPPAIWPARVFAPYVDMTLYPTFNLVTAMQTAGIKYFSLAFITANLADNKPSWGGYAAYEVNGGEFDTAIRAQIAQVRGNRGDVLVSFGGASGTELASAITDVKALQAAYQSVIDAYNLTQIDFDIEGAAAADHASIDRRSQALAALQKAAAASGKSVGISLTLPVLPTGLTHDGLYVVQSAIKYGVKLSVVNVMAMDYGDSAAPGPAGKMGKYAIDSATSLFGQLKTLYGTSRSDTQLWGMVGITPMIGLNDITTEVFDQAAARELEAFALQKGIGRLAFWSLNRDFQNKGGAIHYVDINSSSLLQDPYDFSRIFVVYGS